ncbi:MAG: electron transport complex subunit E [Cellulosilyticum sp.]|nr:electron transport complex subunit E [Cellulosilyticum sp.]
MSQLSERLHAGLIKDNPTFVQVLGMCPTLAVTTSAINAMGMGLSTTAVLICSNLVIALIRNLIPAKIRIPSYIVVIASFVTVIEFLLKAYVPSLYSSLGLFIPLIVVNCIILGRAEAYASKNKPLASVFDGLGMGLGFTCSLTVIGCIREILGVGSLFGIQIMPSFYPPATVMILAPGAFFTLGILMAVLNSMKAKK